MKVIANLRNVINIMYESTLLLSYYLYQMIWHNET